MSRAPVAGERVTLRSLGKTAFACAYTWSGARGPASTMPHIFGYHRVVENFSQSAVNSIPSMLISKAMLERHMDWLAKRFRMVSLYDIGLHLDSERMFHHPTAAITFDDGYADVYENAFPLLKRKGIPAAVFVVTDLIGSRRAQIYDRLYVLVSRAQLQKADLAKSLGLEQQNAQRAVTDLLARFPQDEVEKIISELEWHIKVESTVWDEMLPMTWEMIEEMRHGGFVVGSHTKTHALLTSESLARVRRELSESKQVLETRLQEPIRHFAFPDGRYTRPVLEAVAAAGYRFAYAICRSGDARYPLLTIPRKILWERACLDVFGRFSSAIMNCQTRWAFDTRRQCEHDHAADT